MLEPAPVLPVTERATLVSLMAALLLEAVGAEGAGAGGPEAVVESEGSDEQDRA